MAKNENPLEQWEGEQFAKYLNRRKVDFTHVPNETGSDEKAKRRAIRMKRAGTSPGFIDYLIFPIGFNIAIELKRIGGPKATPNQIKWLRILARQGFHCAVAYGHKEAIEFYESVVGKEVVEF